MDGFPILSLMMAVPMAGAIACLFVGANSARWIALIATLVDFVLGMALWARPVGQRRAMAVSGICADLRQICLGARN